MRRFIKKPDVMTFAKPLPLLLLLSVLPVLAHAVGGELSLKEAAQQAVLQSPEVTSKWHARPPATTSNMWWPTIWQPSPGWKPAI
jgi:hypothetical protein